MQKIDSFAGRIIKFVRCCKNRIERIHDGQKIFRKTGDGHLTVAHEDSADKYTVLSNLATKTSARTMGLDLKTHKIFLPAADFDPAAPGERRGKMKTGSFVLLVASPN